MSVNRVILIGNLGKDPEMRATPSGVQVCRFSLATNERKKENGNWVDSTEWHNIVAFNKTAELCSQYLKKGSKIFLEGKIQYSKWKDKEGKDRYSTEIIASNVQFLSGKDAPHSGSRASDSMSVEHVAGQEGPDFDAPVPSAAEIAAGKNLISGLASADQMSGKGSSKSAPSSVFDDDDIPF